MSFNWNPSAHDVTRKALNRKMTGTLFTAVMDWARDRDAFYVNRRHSAKAEMLLTENWRGMKCQQWKCINKCFITCLNSMMIMMIIIKDMYSCIIYLIRTSVFLIWKSGSAISALKVTKLVEITLTPGWGFKPHLYIWEVLAYNSRCPAQSSMFSVTVCLD